MKWFDKLFGSSGSSHDYDGEGYYYGHPPPYNSGGWNGPDFFSVRTYKAFFTFLSCLLLPLCFLSCGPPHGWLWHAKFRWFPCWKDDLKVVLAIEVLKDLATCVKTGSKEEGRGNILCQWLAFLSKWQTLLLTWEASIPHWYTKPRRAW
jgi:hypothetical protein